MGKELIVDRKLEDNDLIDLGDGIELRVIHLPGHTAGSVGYYWEKEGILFSGDSVSGLQTGNGRFPVIWDLQRYEKSVERLQKIPIDLLLCAHHYRGITLPPNPIRHNGEVKQYLEDSQQAARSLNKAVQEIASREFRKSFMEVANEAIAKLPDKMGFTKSMQMQHLYCAMTIFFRLNNKQR